MRQLIDRSARHPVDERSGIGYPQQVATSPAGRTAVTANAESVSRAADRQRAISTGNRCIAEDFQTSGLDVEQFSCSSTSPIRRQTGKRHVANVGRPPAASEPSAVFDPDVRRQLQQGTVVDQGTGCASGLETFSRRRSGAGGGRSAVVEPKKFAIERESIAATAVHVARRARVREVDSESVERNEAGQFPIKSKYPVIP